MGNSDAEAIIQKAPAGMREMLKSVYDFNAIFAKKTGQEKLLEEILFAMFIVDRKFFVPGSEEEIAYIDNALPIGKGQTISQPSTVARMLLLSELKESDSVLEVGTGSGWNACLIAFLVYPGKVVSTERILELIEKAQQNIYNFKENLKENNPELFQRFSKLKLETKNVLGRYLKTKYDKIIITAGIAGVETEKEVGKIAENLKEKGILVCPYISGPICIYKKQKGELKKTLTNEFFSFVPLLKGLEKWSEKAKQKK